MALYLIYFRISKTLDFSYLTQRRFNSTMIKHRQTFALLALRIHSSIALEDKIGASFILRHAYPTVFFSTGCFEHFTKFMTGRSVNRALVYHRIHNSFHLIVSYLLHFTDNENELYEFILFTDLNKISLWKSIFRNHLK